MKINKHRINIDAFHTHRRATLKKPGCSDKCARAAKAVLRSDIQAQDQKWGRNYSRYEISRVCGRVNKRMRDRIMLVI